MAAPLQDCGGGNPPPPGPTCVYLDSVADEAGTASVAASSDTELSEAADVDVRPRIVGGRESVPGCRPYQAMIIDRFGQFCGGTLIGDQWVLSAAHCFEFYDPSLSVRLGAHSISANDGETIAVTQVIRHPNYQDGVFDGWDIALLRLASPASPEHVRAVIPTFDVEALIAADGEPLTVSGWGTVDRAGTVRTDVLKEGELYVKNLDACAQELPGVTSNDICGSAFDTYSCYGDSGGPLAGRAYFQWYVVGVVSWGGSSCDTSTVFTRTAVFADWITANTGIQPG